MNLSMQFVNLLMRALPVCPPSGQPRREDGADQNGEWRGKAAYGGHYRDQGSRHGIRKLLAILSMDPRMS